jgi:hypothetical protein
MNGIKVFMFFALAAFVAGLYANQGCGVLELEQAFSSKEKSGVAMCSVYSKTPLDYEGNESELYCFYPA